MSDQTDESPRFRGIKVLTNCEHCGMPLPLPGPIRRAHCSHCQETNEITPALWQELLDGVDCQARSFAVPGKFDVDVEKGPPPEELMDELEEDAFPTPDWLAPLVPSTRMFYGAQAELTGRRGKSVEVDQATPKPVVMSCPECSGSLKITTDSPRTTTCEYCSVDIYLPDELWRRLHPVTKATRWYVTFVGENVFEREQRLAELGRLRDSLRAKRHTLEHYWLTYKWGVFLAALVALPVTLANCGLGLLTTDDPLFGYHAKLVCPRICDGCAGYVSKGGAGDEMGKVYCRGPSGEARLPGGFFTLFGLLWAPWWVVLSIFSIPWVRKKRRRAHGELPGLERQISILDQQIGAG